MDDFALIELMTEAYDDEFMKWGIKHPGRLPVGSQADCMAKALDAIRPYLAATPCPHVVTSGAMPVGDAAAVERVRIAIQRIVTDIAGDEAGSWVDGNDARAALAALQPAPKETSDE